MNPYFSNVPMIKPVIKLLKKDYDRIVLLKEKFTIACGYIIEKEAS